MFLLKRPNDLEIQSFISRQQHGPLSYAPSGLTNTLPTAGYNIDHHRFQLGIGATTFHHASSALRQWKMFDFDWLHLWPTDTPIETGSVVAVVVHHLGFWSMNACRIVSVIKEDSANYRRYGFAYGTLLEHAERGEERFMIEWNKADDSVWYDILAVSKPRLLARLGYWYARRLQRKFARDSMQAMRRNVIAQSC
jgi:uncharacterized protein (UPF0548 family)